MIKAMDTNNQIGYPIFTPNQVLTKDDLNNTVTYLDGLNRLTRTHLIGMGIVCGLEMQTLNNSAGIKIAPGCGLTSEGFCIQYLPNTHESGELKNTFTHYQDEVSLSKNIFIPNESSQENYLVKELLTDAEAKTKTEKIYPLKALSESELQQHVLVILYDWEDVARSDYCQLNYDDHGQERSFRLRFLLLPSLPTQQDANATKVYLSAERLLRQGYQIDKWTRRWKDFPIKAIFEARNHFLQKFDPQTNKFQDFAPQVQRFGYIEDKKTVEITEIKNYQNYQDNYYLICRNTIDAIDKAFRELFLLFSPFFTAFYKIELLPSGDEFSKLKENLNSLFDGIKLKNLLDNIQAKKIKKEIQILKPEQLQSAYYLQYFYDYLSLLVAAYYELAEAAFDLMDDCPPDTQRFPRFLMLGLIPSPSQASEVYATPSAYRSHFTQPPIYNSNQVRVKQVFYLYERLLKLCQQNSFYLLPFYNIPLKITPSKDQSAPLSEQAIPYYLNYPNLYQYWNYDAYRKGRIARHPAYFYPKKDSQENIHVFDDMTYRLDAYNFYRIEGHIGKASDNALKHVQEYRQRYSLAFDVITLKLDSQASLQDLNLSGQFDDLESDFKRMKEKFLHIWAKYATEPKNVLLHTLKQVFFDQSGLTVINSSQLFNPILEIARKPEGYKFVKGDTEQRFNLFVLDKNNTHIARFVTQTPGTEGNSLENFEDLSIDLTGVSNDAIDKEKQRIAKEMASSLSQGKITYGIVIDSSSSSVHYHLKLSTEYDVNLPPSNPQTGTPSRKYPIILLSLNHFTVRFNQDNQPIITESEFQDFDTLYSLLRDVPESFNTQNYQIGNSQAAEELNYFELLGLINTYQQRLEQLMKLHLFDKFAQQHPGMEHLGGVPKGGTFILVYVDGEDAQKLLAPDKDPDAHQEATKRTKAIQEVALLPPSLPDELPAQELTSNWELLLLELQKRKDIVVGDFCLPYRCGSDALPVNYILARSRPIILLERSFFCEGDSRKYEFTLEPEGGTVRGKGVLFEGTKQFFQPSSIDQASKDDLAKGLEVAITFAYAVDDTYDTLTVNIYPLPDASFQIGSESNKTTFCANDVPVSLNSERLGGAFRVLLGQEDISTDVLNTQSHPPQFIPHAVKLGDAGQVQLTIEYTVTSDKSCANSAQQQVTIFALPDAGFQIGNEANTTSFCANDDPVALAPNLEGGIFQVLDDEANVLEDIIDNNQFNPSAIKLAEDEKQKVITLVYTITSEHGCTNTTQQQVTIFALPDASFQVGNEANKTSFCINDAPVFLAPNLEGGTFQALDETGNFLEDIIDNNQFNPSAVKLGEDEKQKVITLVYTITSEHGCTNTAQQQVTIFTLPDAGFQVGNQANKTSFCANDEPVSLAPNLEGGRFQALDDEGNVLEDIIDNNQFNPSAVKLSQDESQKVITLVYTITSDHGCTNSTQQQVTIFALPDAGFLVGNQANKTNFCTNDAPVFLTPKLPGGAFRVFAGEEDISADVLNDQSNPPQLILSSVKLDDAKQVTLTVEYTITNQNSCTNKSFYNLTVHRVPVGNFEAEIANINAQGFSIRVFNIQPAQETSFNFVWEHPDGSRNTSNPGNSEFIINYNYDFNTWVAGAEVSVTLRINTPPSLGSCSSEPITKNIPIPFGGVQKFNLLTMMNNQVINTTALENDRTFKISDFNPNNQYAIEAVTVPATVGSVVFTYTAPHARVQESSPVNTRPYRLPDGWQPIIGVHRIKAQVFEEINGAQLEGTALSVILRINNNDTGTGTPTTPTPPLLLDRLRNILRINGKDIGVKASL